MSLKKKLRKALSLVLAVAIVGTIQIPMMQMGTTVNAVGDADVVIDFSQEAGAMIPKTGWLLIPNEDIGDGRILPLNTRQVRDDTDMQAVLGNHSDVIDDAHMSDILPNEFNRFERMAEAYTRLNDLGIKTTAIMGFMPSWISKNGTSQGAPKDFDMWHQWSKDLAQYIKDNDIGIEEFNVWNENWNISQDEFNEMYKESWYAVKQIMPDALMIGPDTVGSIPQSYLDYCADNGLTADVLAYHFVDNLEDFQEDLIKRANEKPSLGVQKYYYQEYQWNTFNLYETMAHFAEFDRTSSVDVACRGIWQYGNGLSDMLVLNPESENICARTPSWWLMTAYGSMSGTRIKSEKEAAVPYIASKDEEKGEMIILVGSNAARTVSIDLENQPFAGEDLVIEKYQVLGEGGYHISQDEDNGIQMKDKEEVQGSGETVSTTVNFETNNDIWMLVVKKADSAPSDFCLMGPDDNTAASQLPIFTWQEAQGADSYDLVISKNKDMSSPVYTKEGITENEFTLDQELEIDQLYYWTITAKNQNGEKAPYNNMYYSFIVKENENVPGGFTLFQVVNNAYGTKLNPRFTWSKSKDATSYDVYISENKDFSDATIKTFQLSELTEYPTDKSGRCYGFELQEALNPETHYYTKVVAKNANGTRTMTGEPHQFTTTTANGKPADFKATTPADETASVDPRFTLRWERSLGGFFYQLEVATDPDFEDIVMTRDWITVPAYTMEQDVLEPETTYYWRVSAMNKERTLMTENSNGVQTFTTSKKPTAPLTKVAVSASNGAIVMFNPVADADTYTVKYGTTSGKYTDSIEGITEANVYLPLEAGNTYYATVVAVRNGMESDVWNEVKISASAWEPQEIELKEKLECENAKLDGDFKVLSKSNASGQLIVNLAKGASVEYAPMVACKHIDIAYSAEADTSVALYNGGDKVMDIFLPETEGGSYGTVSIEGDFEDGDTLKLVKESNEKDFLLDYIVLKNDSVENLALGKTTTGTAGVNYETAKAVDGNLGTWWDAGTVGKGDITVDLQFVSKVHSIAIQMPSTFCARKQEIEVFASATNNESGSFQSVKAKETYTFDPAVDDNKTVIAEFDTPIDARYIKIMVTATEDICGQWNNAAQAGEIYIMGVAGEGIDESNGNLALHKPVTASGTWQGEPERITDGNVGNDYTSSWDGTKGIENIVTIDLGRPYLLTDYELQIPFSFGKRNQDFSFLVSQNGQEFTEIIPKQSYTFDPAVDQNTVKITLPETVTARYVQLIGTYNDADGGLYGPQIAEWRVYGSTEPVSGIAIEPTADIKVLGNKQLTANVTPDNATYKAVAWSSSDISVATADSNGVVTGISAGTAEIRARSLDGNYKAVCTVTVTNNKVKSIEKPAEQTVKYNTPADELVLPKNLKITLEDQTQLNAKVDWDTSNYDGSSANTYVLIGEVSLPNGIDNPGNLKAEAKITVLPAVDKSALQDMYNQYSKLDEVRYTTDSWADFREALDNAKKVLNDKDALQEQVNEAKTDLAEMYLKLVERGDKSDLQDLYNEYAKLDESKYTTDSWADFKAALDNAKKVLDNKDAVQEQINEAKTDLAEMYLKLVERGDKSDLQGLYNEYEKLDESKYTTDSWADFKAALDNAKKVLDNKDATQKQIYDVEFALEKAFDALKKNDKTESSGNEENSGTSGNDNTSSTSKPGGNDKSDLPKTGDTMVPMMITIGLLVLAASGAAYIIWRKKTIS